MIGVLVLVIAQLCVVAEAAESSPDLSQIKHLIIFMQENRPFDHYFGTLSGVRGFNDRTPPVLSTGRDSFHQPIDKSNTDLYMLPFRTIANETNAMCMPAPLMAYDADMGIWNHGRVDGWNTARDPGYGMAYFTREDLPYYYTLYDNFLVGDQYFQSSYTCTNPNRMHLFTGSNGLSVDQGCVLDNTEPRPGYNWTTVAETLTAKGISWKVYQEIDNFDDNAFAWFRSFQESRPGDLLFDQGLKRYASLFKELDDDMTAGKLPTVSWIIAPHMKSEHATNHPCAGEDFTARVLQVLQKHPEVYRDTLFILNYDEGGQFYDHALPPSPPLSEKEGFSSVTVHGEVNTEVWTTEPAPIGLGFRVPLLLISPWTRGRLVYSEVLDHTSVLQFMEQWLGISVDTISPWRRLVTGDLVHALDFDHPDYSWPTNLPDTSDYVKAGDIECHTLPDPIIPSEQHMPGQEPGTRISRALPYEVLVRDVVQADGSVQISVQNTGSEGIPLILTDVARLRTVNPRQIALAPDATFTYVDATIKGLQEGEVIDTVAHVRGTGDYAAVLYGPNGYLREFRGNSLQCSQSPSAQVNLQASLRYSVATEEVLLDLVVEATENTPADLQSVAFTVSDPAAYGHLGENTETTLTVPITRGEASSKTFAFPTTQSGHWYDLTVAASLFTPAATDVSCLYRRFMGRMETGTDTTSDPAMAKGVGNWLQLLQGNNFSGNHPRLPPHVTRQMHRRPTENAKLDKDARFVSKDFPIGKPEL